MPFSKLQSAPVNYRLSLTFVEPKKRKFPNFSDEGGTGPNVTAENNELAGDCSFFLHCAQHALVTY